MIIRTATLNDATAIAALHARSWQIAYRGDFTDHYLDVECPAERLGVWTKRLSQPEPNMHCAVVYEQDDLAGFCCTFDQYDEHGAYLDNLHVAPEYQGRGLGKQLLKDAAHRVAAKDIYLVVLTSNTSAISFYERMNGRLGFTKMFDLAGTLVEVVSVHWEVEKLR